MKHDLGFERHVKNTTAVQVKHVDVIPLFHFFQHDVQAAQDWQPAESTKNCIRTIIIAMWVIVIQPQSFEDKYLQCVFPLKGLIFLVFACSWAVCVQKAKCRK